MELIDHNIYGTKTRYQSCNPYLNRVNFYKVKPSRIKNDINRS